MKRNNCGRLFFLMLLLCAVHLLFPLAGRAASSERHTQVVLLEIDQEKITLADFLLYLRQINPLMDFAKLAPSEQRHWLDEFVAKKLFAIRAREAKLDQTPEVRARIEFFTDGVLAQEFKDRTIHQIGVTEEELTAYYSAHQEEFKLPPRVLLQHFLYKTPEKAAQTQAKLRQGAPFSQIAEQVDPGFLVVERHWFTPDLLIPEVREIAFQLSVGGVSDVIRSSYGYHVLYVEAQEPSHYKDFEAARGEILDKVRQAKASRLYQQILDETKNNHHVRLHLEGLQP